MTSGVFGDSDYKSEVKLKKFINLRLQIQYGGRTFWLKFLFPTFLSQYASSGAFAVSDYESEVELQKLMNSRWRIPYGGRTFRLKF